MYTLIAFCALALGVIASPAPLPVLEPRATTSCNRDNLFRCFVASSRLASSYCSSVLGTSTVTVATVTPTRSVTDSRTSTAVVTTTSPFTALTTTTTTALTTQLSTATAVSTTTVTVYVTVTATSFTTNVVATATVTAAPIRRIIKRGNPLPLLPRAAATPQCVTMDGTASTSYAPSRITSACSCLGVTASTVRVTSTATPVTARTTQSTVITTTSTSTATVTSTITITSTNTVSTTTTTTTPVTTSTTVTTTGATTTVTVPSTALTTVSPTACTPPTGPPCGLTSYTNRNGAVLSESYMGCGFSNVNDNDYAANIQYGPSATLCSAFKDCADTTTGFSSDFAPNGGFSLALYQYADGSIECNIFAPRQNGLPTAFTQRNANVKAAFGYTRG